jgi:dihydroorotate dehydrogenase (NAD+) catalytic subunit
MYNPLVSYEENLRLGPSPEWNSGGFFPQIRFTGAPMFSCLGHPLHLPLGMPAGPLLSAAYLKVALEAGFSMPVYKTVRSSAWKSHPWPNVLGVENFLESQSQQRPVAQVTPLSRNMLSEQLKSGSLSITNAFGVPSSAPEQWASDFASLPESAFSAGSMSVLSFQGSRRDGQGWSAFLDDTARCARLAAEVVSRRGGKILEMNVSCPNESGAPIYTDLNALGESLDAAASALRDFPGVQLIVKLGQLEPANTLAVVERVARCAHGISAINTLSANIVDLRGQRALGSGAEHGGICGEVIRTTALTSMRQLSQARRALGLDKNNFALVGVGGCFNSNHVCEFLEAGADVVHAATGAMWNLQFASECARRLGVRFSGKESV